MQAEIIRRVRFCCFQQHHCLLPETQKMLPWKTLMTALPGCTSVSKAPIQLALPNYFSSTQPCPAAHWCLKLSPGAHGLLRALCGDAAGGKQVLFFVIKLPPQAKSIPPWLCPLLLGWAHLHWAARSWKWHRQVMLCA